MPSSGDNKARFIGDFEVEDYVPLSPAILALRLQRIIRIDMFIKKIKQYDDFQEAIELEIKCVLYFTIIGVITMYVVESQ